MLNYFDYAATTPLHPDAARVFTKLSTEHFGNTSSLHDVGGDAQHLLQFSRQYLAQQLNVSAMGIHFTGGGTESNIYSLIALARANEQRGKHIIASAGEHPSIDSALRYLEEQGFKVTTIPFDSHGKILLDLLEQAITNETAVVSIQHINPELGTIQPIEKIAQMVRSQHIYVHSDCIQSFGKIDIRSVTEHVDSFTLSSHKIYGPKGVGVAYVDPKIRRIPLFPGTIHENGFRGGTVNVPGIAAFITAASLLEENIDHYKQLRKTFFEVLKAHRSSFTFYEAATQKEQLPHIIGLGVRYVEGQLVMLELNRLGFAISTGSACQVGMQIASKAMQAMQIDEDRAKEFVRISFGKSSTVENVTALAKALIQIAKRFQAKPMINYL